MAPPLGTRTPPGANTAQGPDHDPDLDDHLWSDFCPGKRGAGPIFCE